MKKVIIGSLILAILHSVLFYEQRLGISVILYMVPLVFFIINILDEKGKIKNQKPLLLLIPITILSTTYCIFNNTFFQITNMVVIIILTIMMIVMSILEETKIRNIIVSGFTIIGKPFVKIEEVVQIIVNQIFTKEENLPSKKEKYKTTKKIALGIFVSLPILVIIVILLASADQIFAGKVDEIMRLLNQILKHMTIREIIYRAIFILLLTIYGAAFIYNLIESENKKRADEEKSKINFDNIIINTILTILNLVYIVFCYIQIVNLFMGYTTLDKNEYANYARQGFFQLMAVSLINLVIILVTTHNEIQSSNMQKNYTKVMNLMLAIFTFIILISSFMRMYLYEQTFGYTFLRLMVYMILITEAILMIPTIAHIFDKNIKLAKPYFIVIIVMYIFMNYMNIDYIIAKKNIDRYFNVDKQQEKNIDFTYLKTTGIDGASEIRRLLNADDENLRVKANNYLHNQKEKVENRNWQEFNINQYRLKKELKDIDKKENMIGF